MEANAFFAAVIPLATVGVVQLYNQLKVHDWEGVVTILVAGAVGLVAGLTHYLGLSIADALTLAMAAVGIHTATKNIG
jgi:uncharacterized membrane protein HdeD (DUF308 family)